MEPFEALTELDKQKFISYVEKFGPVGRTDATMDADLDYVLRYWNKNKEKFFHMFGDKLIIKKVCNVNINDTASQKQIQEYLRTTTNPFCRRFREWASENCVMEEEDAYVNQMKALFILDSTTLLSNRVAYGFTYTKKDGKKVKVPYEAKAMGILGKIAKEYNIEGFEQFRIDISRFTEVRMTEVEITLSIHPLDFITMSDNANGWESCMNWTDGPGSYRAGTVEMLNSPNTVMAYITSKNCQLGPIEWNSKSWRELVIIDPYVLSTVKAYPFRNVDFDKAVVRWLADLAKESFGYEYNFNHPMYTLDSYTTVDDEIWGEDYYTVEFDTNFMYNDFGNTDNYAVFSLTPPDEQNYYLNYSGPWCCMLCGSTDIPDGTDGESVCVVCDDCDAVMYCELCGNVIRNSNYSEVDGMIVCGECYWDLNHSMIDGEAHLNDNLVKLYVWNTEKSKIDSRYGGHFITENEVDDLPEFFGNPDLEAHWELIGWPHVIVVNDVDLTEENLKTLIKDSTEDYGFELTDWYVRNNPVYYC